MQYSRISRCWFHVQRQWRNTHPVKVGVLCVLVGVVANIAIAWLGAATLTIDTRRDLNRRATAFFEGDAGLNYDHYHGRVLGEVALLKMRDWDADRTEEFGSFDTDQLPAWTFDNPDADATTPMIGHQYEAYGWPWRSMALGWFWQSPGTFTCERGVAIGSARCDDEIGLARALPLGIVQPGFVGNSMVFAAIVASIWWMAVRRSSAVESRVE